MEPLPVYILAGGRSSRFGSDKARVEIAGLPSLPLIVSLAQQLAPVASRLRVVAELAGKYDDLGLETIGDRLPGQGPLGGLHAALADADEHDEAGWLLLASCDLVEVRPRWVSELFAHVRRGIQAVAFRDDRWQPMPALYHTSLAELVERQLAAIGRATLRQAQDRPSKSKGRPERSRGAMWRLLEVAATVAVPPPADWPDIAQINTPADYAAYLRRLGR